MPFDKKITIVITLCLFLLLLFSLFVIFNFFAVKVANNYTVHNINTGLNYKTIQAAIDADETLNGHTIFVEKGIYYEDILLNKSLSLVGENKNGTIIDGNETNIVIHTTANNVTIKGFTVRNGTIGIYLDHSKNSLIMANNVSCNEDAILARYSNNCTVHQNLVANNTDRGILITNSWNFTVNNNNVFKSGGYGINANASTNGIIEQNNANENNYDGIGLLDSNNCTVAGNNATGNTFFGILVDASSFYNLVCHNDIIKNGIQASGHPSINRWDNGIEGNYWSDYSGADSDYDGIGDSPYDVAQDVQDNYPLFGMFYSFNTSLERHVEIISNSTIMSFEYFQSNHTIRMHVFGEEGMGFCRMCIPMDLIHSPYHIIIDTGLTPVLNNRIVYENGTREWVYFAYQPYVIRRIHEIVITQE